MRGSAAYAVVKGKVRGYPHETNRAVDLFVYPEQGTPKNEPV